MKLVPLMIIFVAVAIFVTIMPNIFGSFEEEHNMTASDYETEYNSLTAIVQANMAVIMGIGTLLVLGLVFIMGRVILG